MNDKKRTKIAAILYAASMAAGVGVTLSSCDNKNEAYYAHQLQKRLEFKLDKDFDLGFNKTADYMDYNFAIVDVDPTIGLILEGGGYYKSIKTDELEARFVVDKDFYNEFITSDLGNIETLYEYADNLIVNYDPSIVKINDSIVYSTQSNDMVK